MEVSFVGTIDEIIVVVQSLSRVGLFAIPWTACSTPGFAVLHYLLGLA